MKNGKLLIRIGGWIAGIVISFFLIRTLLQNWNQVKDAELTINYWLLIPSFIFMMGNFVVGALAFYHLLKGMGERTTFPTIFKVITIANLGAYIPGRIWTWVGLAVFTTRYGISKIAMGSSVVVNQLLTIISSLAFSSFLILAIPEFHEYWFSLAIIPIGLLIVHPRVLQYFVNIILKIFRRPPKQIELTYFTILKVFIILIISFLLEGLAFAFFVNAITPVSLQGSLASMFSFPFARIVGYLSIIVPAGIGVRESVITLVLKGFLSVSIAVAVAFGYRVFFIIGRMVPLLFVIGIRPELSSAVSDANES